MTKEATKHRIKDLCITGLRTDGGHHKQWCLEEILRELGFKLEDIARKISDEEAYFEDENKDEYWEAYNEEGLFWEKGIPP